MNNEKQRTIRYADLFGGVGGFRKGIGDRGKCVFYSDIDKYSVQTYNKNFNENHKPTDIRSISTDDIPEIDMLCGGFPCQAFSIAGKRRGFQDTRGTLFFEIARIIKAKRPKIIFLENVKGLLNHNKGETFRTILQTISELGYDIQWMVLNSKFFGVPQNRERVFIIGSLRGTSKSEILPFRESCEYISEGDTSGIPTSQSLRAGYYKGGQGTHIASQGQRVYSPEGISKTISDGGGQEAKTGLYMMVNSATKKGYSEAEVGDGIRLEYPESKTARGRVIKQNANTLKSGTEGVVIDVSKKIKQRTTNPNQEEIRQYLSEWRNKEKITIEEIEKHFGNQAGHHWFERKGSVPDVDDWIELKKILKFDDKYDKLMTTYRWITEWELMNEHKNRHQSRGNGFGFQTKSPEEQAGTLTATEKGIDYNLIDNKLSIRRLTPTECERLQGFPDGWTEGLSDTQRYKQMGNAVTVNVIEAIAKKLLKNPTKSEVKHREVTKD